jgi:hypothetical protein
MSVLSAAAALGLFVLVSGVVVVNVATSPPVAQVGMIVAGIGGVTLAVVAVGHLLT